MLLAYLAQKCRVTARLLPNLIVALLPLAAHDTGVPYSVLPSASELNAMTSELRAGIVAGGVAVVPQERVAQALRTAGYKQTIPARACAKVDCARRIGRSVGADRVVFGSVTRAMALIWSTDYYIVDVRTGKVTPFTAGYKGDVQSMTLADRYAGSCIARALRGQRPCASDKEW